VADRISSSGNGLSALTTHGIVAAGTVAVAQSAHAAGSDVIKVALIGAGGRGSGAAVNVLKTKANVKLIAIADAFADRAAQSLKGIQSQFSEAERQQKIDVPNDRIFIGLDGYEKAIAAGPDLVLCCTPPGFRPLHFEAAVKAGKHVFLEKPVATDAPGLRRVLAANQEAKKKNLSVLIGHHLRHETKHREVVKRIHDGAIGDVLSLRVYFNTGPLWLRPRTAGQTELEYQVRNWYYFTWLSGDHIVEQHVHDIDVGNWIKQAHPVKANGMGGRQVRVGKDYGDIFDHHNVEFTYADGSRMFSMCRQIPGCWGSFSQHAHGTKGYAEIEGHGKSALYIKGQDKLSWKRDTIGHQVEMDDLLAALSSGQTYNDCDEKAQGTMTAILGRMATHSGKEVSWDEAFNSNLDLAPARLAWDAEPKNKPGADGLYPCSVPGSTKAY